MKQISSKTVATVGAAIIAKNEEKNIERCINSIKNICNQIVVVDTDSDDKTPIIAAKLGANVFFHNWKNDFSIARNYAINYLQTDWIISIDADEELIQNDFFANFENILNNKLNNKSKEIGGITVILNNFLDSELKTFKQHKYTRIFRNHKSIKFSGQIHEQIADSIINSGFEIADSGIIFNHYGYMDKNTVKEIRNKNLLESSINAGFGDDYLVYHLAITEFSMGNLEKSLELFNSIKNSEQLTISQKEEIKIKIAQIFLRNEQFAEAIKALDFHSDNLDSEGLRLSILGVSYLSLSDFQQAKIIYNSPEISQSNLVDKSVIRNAQAIFSKLNI